MKKYLLLLISMIKWFNFSSPYFSKTIYGKYLFIRLWNFFNRVSKDGHFWGIGLLQIGNRHLIYVGHSGISLFFIGESK
jgi:hypothetical protein